MPLAAYAIWAAKEYVDYRGGRTFVRVLLDDGTDVRISGDEIKASEDYMTDTFQFLGKLIGFGGGSISPDTIDMATYAELLRKRVLDFRSKQAVFR